MKVLAARILERQQQEAHAEAAETRRVQVGSGIVLSAFEPIIFLKTE